MARRHLDILHVPTCTDWGFWRNALHVYFARLEALRAAIRELAGSETLRETLGRFNAHQAREEYSVERTMEEIASVYRRMTPGRINSS